MIVYFLQIHGDAIEIGRILREGKQRIFSKNDRSRRLRRDSFPLLAAEIEDSRGRGIIDLRRWSRLRSIGNSRYWWYRNSCTCGRTSCVWPCRRVSCWPPGRIAEGRPLRDPLCPLRAIWSPATSEWRSRIRLCTRAPCCDPPHPGDHNTVPVARSRNRAPDLPPATPRFGTNPCNRAHRSSETENEIHSALAPAALVRCNSSFSWCMQKLFFFKLIQLNI